MDIVGGPNVTVVSPQVNFGSLTNGSCFRLPGSEDLLVKGYPSFPGAPSGEGGMKIGTDGEFNMIDNTTMVIPEPDYKIQK